MKRLLCLMLIFAPLLAEAGGGHPTRQEKQEIRQQRKKLKRVYNALTSRYYDTMDYSRVVEAGIKAMVSELDPHTVYEDPQQARVSWQRLAKQYAGLGIGSRTVNDTLVITHVEKGTPACASGLEPGDRIVAVDGKNIVGLGQKEISELLSGEKGVAAELSIVRRPGTQTSRITVVRDIIPGRSVSAAYMMDEHTGYVRLSRFGATAVREFREALSSMSGGPDLIIDLRGNPGGLFDAAVNISSMFLSEGNVITVREGNMIKTLRIKSKRDGDYLSGRVLILVSDSSASASELFTGALQDWDRAVVFGGRTFGKGLGQSKIGLGDDSNLTVTSLRYLTPSGRAIQRPFELGHSEDYYEEFYERHFFRRGEQERGAEYKTLVSGRTVYDSGGITPDIRSGSDTLPRPAFFREVIQKGALYDYVILYLDRNRGTLAGTYDGAGDFAAGFDPAELDLVPLAEMIGSAGIGFSEEEFAAAAPEFREIIVSNIAQLVWGNEEYYKAAYKGLDRELERAYDIMKQWQTVPAGPVTDELVGMLQRAD